MVKAHNINIHFNGEPLFAKGVNIELTAGSKSLLYGSSGHGKTTLYNIIAALTPPTCGDIYWEDYHINSTTHQLSRPLSHPDRIRDRYISMIFSNFYFLNALSTYDNILLPTTILGYDKAYTKARLDRLLEIFECRDNPQISLAHLIKKPIKALSNGQKEIVSIARALMLKSHFIFADELCRSFNDDDQQQVWQQFCIALKEFNFGLFMITHKAFFKTDKLIDTVYTIHRRVVQKGGVMRGIKRGIWQWLLILCSGYIYALDIYIDDSHEPIDGLERLQQMVYDTYYFGIHFKRLTDSNATAQDKPNSLIISKQNEVITLTHHRRYYPETNVQTSETKLIRSMQNILDGYIKKVHILLEQDEPLATAIKPYLRLNKQFFNIKEQVIMDTDLVKSTNAQARVSIAQYIKKHQLSGAVLIYKKRRSINITTQTYGDDAQRVDNVVVLKQTKKLAPAIVTKVLKQMIELNLLEIKNRKL